MYGGGSRIHNLAMHHESLTFSFKYSTLWANIDSLSKYDHKILSPGKKKNYSNVAWLQDIISQ